VLPILFAGNAHGQMHRYEALADSTMAENRPTPETAKLLRDELLFQRATQTYLWHRAPEAAGVRVWQITSGGRRPPGR
jgi:hypothetical protein